MGPLGPLGQPTREQTSVPVQRQASFLAFAGWRYASSPSSAGFCQARRLSSPNWRLMNLPTMQAIASHSNHLSSGFEDPPHRSRGFSHNCTSGGGFHRSTVRLRTRTPLPSRIDFWGSSCLTWPMDRDCFPQRGIATLYLCTDSANEPTVGTVHCTAIRIAAGAQLLVSRLARSSRC